jgi:transposase
VLLQIPGLKDPIDIPDEDFAKTPESVLRAFMGALEKLAARVAELEERLNANSRNSSLPPSKDPPGTLRSPKQRSGKKKGGQPGHKGAFRSMVDGAQVTDTQTFKLPDHCPDCASEIPVDIRSVSRRQIWEVPKIVPHVLEICREYATCPCCRKKLRAEVPASLPRGEFGPNLVALVGILQGRFSLSHRDCQELLAQLTGIRVGLGTIPRLCQQVSGSLEEFHNALGQHVRNAPVLNIDDTAWKLGKTQQVLFSLNTPDAAFFQIEPRKNHTTVRKILGHFTGILGADRASTYSCHSGRLQHCLAHLDRHFLRIWDRGGASRAIGAQGRKEMDRIWALWTSFGAKLIDRQELQRKLKPIKARVGRLLKAGVNCAVAKTSRTCARVLKSFRWMWTFAEFDGVEPTNNISEQAVRLPVCWRRTSFSSQSDGGLRFTERILSAVLTCARRGANVWDFLAESCAKSVGTLTLLPQNAPARS